MYITNSTRFPQVYGHRGCRGLFPENTLPAFLHALKIGVDVLELDVVISADNQVVVAHEPWLSARLGLGPTGQPIDPATESSLNMYKLPYATIRQSVVGTLPHPLFPEQQLLPTYRPLLVEVLLACETACQELGRPPVGYAIELKSTPATDQIFHPMPAEFVALVVEAIPASVLPRVELLCFDARVLLAARDLVPSLSLCFLIEEQFTPSLLIKEAGFVPDTIGPDFQLLTADVLRQLRLLYPAVRVVPWTVNTPDKLAQLMAWGVDAITSDYPDRAIKARNNL